MAPPQPLQLSRTFLISPIVWSRPRQQQLQHSAMPAQSKEAAAYHFAYPEEGLRFRDHFSSLLFSGDWGLTLLELGSLAGLTTAAVLLPAEKVNVEGSMPLRELAALLWTKVAVTRLYNTYCEAVFFAFPQYRIQPPREHALKAKKDLCGRLEKELEILHRHDCATLLSQLALNVGLYYALPGFYPAKLDTTPPMYERVLRLLGNHYVLSFGMYWMHRSLHVVPQLWDRIHSYHHWARHPLSRNTYQDHWLDNLANAVVGHCWAQILCPLDRETFWFSHILRILESMEKHSGVSCYFNLAHSLQRWLPFAQMPHHHDWHHEGHKGCNYTFCALGGVWDCAFGTRKAGRATDLRPEHTTRHDKAQGKQAGRAKSLLDRPAISLLPVLGVGALVVAKLRSAERLRS